MEYVARMAESRFRRMLRTFPAVLLYGPRQCGKSTFVRRMLPGWRQVDLERPADRALLVADLEGFFDQHGRRVVLDEAQRLPDLFPVLRYVLDREKAKGRFVLLGSAGPGLLRSASESLAGRLGLMELTPLLSSELAGRPQASLRWFWGGFPPVLELSGDRQRAAWMDGYVSNFLERDLPALGLRLSPPRLRTLWTMLTHVHGRLLNVADLSRSLSVSSHTVNAHLDVLESAFMIRRLQPYHANIHKRLTKSPKLYLRDTGLLHFLAGLRGPDDLATWPLRGGSFEGMVIEELAALATEQVVRPGLYFWRTQAGAEVDLLIQHGRSLLPIEIKLGMEVDRHAVAGLKQCMADLGLKRGWVVCNAPRHDRMNGGIEIVPWRHIVEGQVRLPLD